MSSVDRTAAVLLAAAAAGLAACSLLVHTDGLTGGDAGAGLQVVVGPNGRDCACVDPPPPGWQGPAALWEGPGAPADCTSDYPAKVLDGFGSPSAPAAECACACGPVTGATCASSVTVNLFGNNTCGGNKCDTVSLGVNSCVNVQANCFNVNGLSASVPAQGGACAPQPSSKLPQWSWSRAARACETAKPPAQESCGAGKVCTPVTSAPWLARPCIFASGDVACPAGIYQVKHLYFAGATDDRACTPCACGSPTAGCTAQIRQTCSIGSTVSVPTSCAALQDPPSLQLVAAPTLDAGACPPSGGQPTGGVTPTSPTTVCCVP